MSRELLERFFRSERESVFVRFASLPGAIRAEGYVYLEGTRPPAERVLLVAHADTVFANPPSRVDWFGNMAVSGGSSWTQSKTGYSNWRSSGLGADDRAGCALLWTFRNSGHSLLVTDEEETGCIGAAIAADEIGDLLANHRFAVEVDRRGDQNYVFYSVSTPEFEAHVRSVLPQWSRMSGSMSDISVLCRRIGICGVNLAAGYYHEHTSDEIFILDAWNRTRTAVDRLLRTPSGTFRLPRVTVIKSTVKSATSHLFKEEPKSVTLFKQPQTLNPFYDVIDSCEPACEWRDSVVYTDTYVCMNCCTYADGTDMSYSDWEEETHSGNTVAPDAYKHWLEEFEEANEAALRRIDN